jgi:hypothetical protein
VTTGLGGANSLPGFGDEFKLHPLRRQERTLVFAGAIVAYVLSRSRFACEQTTPLQCLERVRFVTVRRIKIATQELLRRREVDLCDCSLLCLFARCYAFSH